MSLRDLLTRGDWESDPGAYDHLVFGDQSLLVQELLAAAAHADFQGVLDALAATDTRRADFATRFLAHDADYPIDRGLAVRDGLRHALLAAQTWCEFRPVQLQPGTRAATDLRDHLQAALASFEKAWRDADRPDSAARAPQEASGAEHPLWPWMGALGRQGTCAGFWITWDLVRRLVRRQTGEAETAGNWQSATTPVLLASPHSRLGTVLWLTVELTPLPVPVFPAGPAVAERNEPTAGLRSEASLRSPPATGSCVRNETPEPHTAPAPDAGFGFDPDPLMLGLTAVQNGRSPAVQAEVVPDLLAVLRRVWCLSGVQTHFRGRWRITGKYPNPNCPWADLEPVYPRRLEGRSVEAAALAAIWAASGRIPYAEPFRPDADRCSPLMLNPEVAVSACLPDMLVVPRTDLRLGPVTNVGRKLRAFQRVGGDTVLLAEDEDASSEEASARHPAAPGSAGPQSFTPLRVERVRTIGEALDHMLITNRYLQRWQDHQRERWLEQWAPGTAEAQFGPSGASVPGCICLRPEAR